MLVLIGTVASMLWYYSKLFFRKWVLWIFFALDAVGAILQYFFPSIMLPQYTYLGVASFGIFWAGFQVFNDVAAKTLSKKMLQPTIQQHPKLSLSLLEGNNYSYNLRTAKNSALPSSVIVIHAKLKNIGELPIELLSIGAKLTLVSYPLHQGLVTVLTTQGTDFSFPCVLEKNNSFSCDIHVGIEIGPTDSEISIAPDLKRFMKFPDSNQVMTVVARTVNPEGEPHVFKQEFSFSTVPLCDLYIALWKELVRQDLLRLIGTSA